MCPKQPNQKGTSEQTHTGTYTHTQTLQRHRWVFFAHTASIANEWQSGESCAEQREDGPQDHTDTSVCECVSVCRYSWTPARPSDSAHVGRR